jgi:hypothetical protein
MLNYLCVVGLDIILCLGEYAFVFFKFFYEGLCFFKGTLVSQVDVLSCVI